MRGLQEVDKFGRDKEPGRLDIEQLPYVQACFKARLYYDSCLFQNAFPHSSSLCSNQWLFVLMWLPSINFSSKCGSFGPTSDGLEPHIGTMFNHFLREIATFCMGGSDISNDIATCATYL